MLIISNVYQSLVVAAFTAQEFLKLKRNGKLGHAHHWGHRSKGPFIYNLLLDL